MSNDNAKRAAGYAAAELIQDGMRVGIGTGSTAFFFIERLIERIKQGLKIEAIATSKKSNELAKSGNIPLLSPDEFTHLDVDVDGADEINSQKQMIKGGGGALFFEKIIASASKEMIVIIDESKRVDKLGKCPLPIEINPFGFSSVVEKLKRLDIQGKMRKVENKPFFTDSGNLILDANIENYGESLHFLDEKIIRIPGVIETGFFWNLAGRVVIGYSDSRFEIKEVL